MSSRPRKITVTRSTRKLVVEWDDGQSCEYSLSDLRAECPCAECKGTHGTKVQEEPEDMFMLPIVNTATTDLDRIEQVGNYAIQLFWKDGHSHGIYGWEYLRRLCLPTVEVS